MAHGVRLCEAELGTTLASCATVYIRKTCKLPTNNSKRQLNSSGQLEGDSSKLVAATPNCYRSVCILLTVDTGRGQNSSLFECLSLYLEKRRRPESPPRERILFQSTTIQAPQAPDPGPICLDTFRLNHSPYRYLTDSARSGFPSL